ncbi:putative beta-glucosidase 18-like [Capsicum annuum]|nr:putative beta-glucosidase 18-like [Capsicum annuum]
MGENAKLFKSPLRFVCFSIGKTKKKMMFPDVKALEIYFPEEIIVEILIRLPVQSLLRFKCISKSCNTLISHPKFKEKHYHHAKNNKKILIAQRFPGTHTIS